MKALLALGILATLAVYIQLRSSGSYHFCQPDPGGYVTNGLDWGIIILAGTFGFYITFLTISYAMTYGIAGERHPRIMSIGNRFRAWGEWGFRLAVPAILFLGLCTVLRIGEIALLPPAVCPPSFAVPFG